MYITSVPNRGSPPCILLRESYRQGGKVCKRTLANLSKWPHGVVEGLRALLKGGVVVEQVENAFEVVRSLPHGHVLAVLGTLRKLGLEALLDRKGSRKRDLVVAMIAARILDPRSKLATARGLDQETAFSSLAEQCGLGSVDEEDLYEAMDWLVERQGAIENALAKRHLKDGTLVLYDVTSTYFEGRTCPLAKLGHNRDKKKGKLQIVFGLLCDTGGRPVAVEVFGGNTGDASTLGNQVRKIRERFGLKRVVLVGDRGMITQARIGQDLQSVEGLDWITALRAPAIRGLVERGELQLSLFDEQNLAEIASQEYPGERLIVCRNPLLAKERSRKREDLLAATEAELEKIVKATQRSRRPLRGEAEIGLRVGKVLNRYKVGKHFQIDIEESRFHYERNTGKIEEEAALDGIYVIRTSVEQEVLSAEKTVGAYKGLAVAERAFRCLKTVDLKVRPIHHRLEERVRAHVFLCMLAYYVEWHMRQALAPILFEDDAKDVAREARRCVVAPAQRSDRAVRKAATKRTEEDLPAHSFQTLLQDLATVVKNRMRPTIPDAPTFDKVTELTPVQLRAFQLLGIRVRCTQ